MSRARRADPDDPALHSASKFWPVWPKPTRLCVTMRSAASLKPVRRVAHVHRTVVGERGRATQWTGGLFGRERTENVPVHFDDDDELDDDDASASSSRRPS